MVTKLRNLATGLIGGVVLAAATFAVPTNYLPGSIGSPTASAITCYSRWKVIWPNLGVYVAPSTSSQKVDTLHSGNIVSTTAGQTSQNGWLHILVDYYVRSAGVTYIGDKCS